MSMERLKRYVPSYNDYDMEAYMRDHDKGDEGASYLKVEDVLGQRSSAGRL